jgi:hypothetical protein
VDTASIYNQMQNDPDFAKLTYAEQVEVRDRLIRQGVTDDPSFSTLDQAGLEQVYKKLVYAPPVFERPEMKGLVDTLTAARDTGDPNAQNVYDSLVNRLGEANGSMGFMTQAATKLASGALNLVIGSQPKNPMDQITAALNNPEAAKAWQWVNAREMVEGLRVSESARVIHDVANVVGNIGDFAASVGGKVAMAVGAKGVIAPATWFDTMRTVPFVAKGIETATTQAARTMFRTVLPAALEGAVIAGPAGVGVSKAISALANDPSTDPFRSFEAFALNYGAGVAFNVTGGLVMRELLPFLGGMAKNVFGRGIGVEKQTLRGQAEVQEGIDRLISAEDTPAALKAQLGPYQQALINYRAELDKIGRTKATDLTDEQQVYFGAQLATPDVVIGKAKDGYTIFTAQKGTDPTVVNLRQHTVPTLYDAADEIARISEARVQDIAKGLTPSDLMLAQKLQQGAPWLAKWHESNVGASRAFDASQPTPALAGFVKTEDRFYVGTNEVNGKLKGFQAIPVKLPVSADRFANLQAGKGAVTYSDLTPLTPDEVGANGILFVRNSIDVPVALYTERGPGSIFATRVQGYDTARLVNEDGTTRAYVPLTPSNVKVLVSQVDAKGHPAPQVKAAMKPASEAGVDLRASVQGTVDTKITTTRLGENAPLMTDFMINRFQGELRAADVQTAVASLRGIEPGQVRVKVGSTKDSLPNNEIVRIRTNADGTIDIDVPASMSNKATTGRFIRELTTKAGLPTGKPGEKLAPTSYAVLERMKGVVKPDLDPMMRIMEGRASGTRIAGPKQLQAMLKKSLGVDLITNPNGSYSAMIRGQLRTGTLADIYKAARPDLVPLKAIQDQFDLLGATVHRQGGRVTVKMLGQPERSYANLHEAAEANGLDLNQLPSEYRPTFIELDPSSGQIQVFAEQATVRLGKLDAFALFNSFAEDSKIQSVSVIKAQKGLASLVETPTEIRIVDQATKTKLNFATVAEAKEWAALQREPYAHLRDMSRLKGMSLDYNKGMFELRTGDPQHPLYRFSNVNDAEKVLAAYNTTRADATEFAPFGDSILRDLPDDLVREWKSLNRTYSPLPATYNADYTQWTPSHKAAIMQNIANFFETFDSAFQKAVAGGHVPPILQEKVNTLRAANEANFAEWFQAERLIGKIFSVGKGGKAEVGSKAALLADDRQRLLYQYLTHEGTDLDVLRQKMPLTLHEQQMVANLRDLTDRLADKFGIPLLKRLPQYMTRVRLAAYEDPKLMEGLRNATTAEEMLSQLQRNPRFNDNAIREMKPWFEKSRKQELMTDVFEDRAMHASLRYLQAGLRKYWLDIPGQDFTNTYNTYRQQLPQSLQSLVENWYGRITNTLDDADSMVAVRDTGRNWSKAFGERMAKGLEKQAVAQERQLERFRNEGDLEGVADTTLEIERLRTEAQRVRSPAFAEEGTKLWEKGMQVSYATMLGLKPMLAVRNTMQLYSMYGPAFGFSHLQDAVKMVTKADEATVAKWADRLMASNDLGPQHPFVSNEQVGGRTGQLVSSALAWYRNADSYSRLVGYLASTSRFADAADKLAKGVFGNDPMSRLRFEKYAGVDVFAQTNRPMADRIWAEAVSGASEGGRLADDGLTYTSQHTQIASDMFAKEAVHTTLFNYASYNKPMMFSKGVFGQLFGQLGMFPASYRGYIMQMLRNLSPSKIASFGLTFIASNLALLAAFKAAGIRTNDFVPLLPGVTGMGPSMEQAMNLFEATGQGPQATSAQRELLAYVSPIVPKKEVLPGYDRALPGAETVLTFNYPQIAPGSAQYYYLSKAATYAQDGDWYKALLSLSTAQVESDSVDLEVPVPGGRVTIPEAHPQQLLQNLLPQVGGTRVPFR